MTYNTRDSCPRCGGVKCKESPTCRKCLSPLHGHTSQGKQSPTYKTWHNMKDRCLNPRNGFYGNYGGRGVRVCNEWMTFKNFLADMGEKPDGQSLDRIDVNGNYEPSNCRWATVAQQADNTTRTIYLTSGGVTKTITQWSRELNIDRDLIRMRIARGWKHEDILTFPAKATSRYFKIPKPIKPIRQPRTLTIGDETRTIAEWARISGLTPGSIWERLRRGATPERAVTAPARTGPGILRQRAKRLDLPLTHNNETRTLEQWAETQKMAVHTLVTRLRRGWTLADALGRPVKTKQPHLEQRAA